MLDVLTYCHFETLLFPDPDLANLAFQIDSETRLPNPWQICLPIAIFVPFYIQIRIWQIWYS